MSWLAYLRALALCAVLALAPVWPSQTETLVLPAASIDTLSARHEARPGRPASTFDPALFNAALGGKARLTYRSSGLDPDTGATRVTGLSFELLGDAPVTLFTASELLVWNADIDALKARLSGERLGETVRLFDRIELSGLQIDLTDYTNSFEDALTSALPETAASTTLMYKDADMTVGRLILNGMTLHPWTFETVEGQDEGVAALRVISALARNLSLDGAALLDSEVRQTLADGGTTGSIVSRYPRQIIDGYHRGDMAAMMQSDVSFEGSIPLPLLDDTGTAPPVPFEMSGSSGYGAWTGLKLAKLFEYGERGEMPPITERDLWSLGRYAIADTEIRLNDAAIVEIGSVEMSADQFAWFFPERINIRHEDVAFNVTQLLKRAEAISPEAAPSDGELALSDIIGILDRTGFGNFSGDGEFTLNWDSDTGETLIANESVADNLYTDNTRIEMRLPAFGDIVPAFGADGLTPDDAALSTLFKDKFVLVGARYSFSDKGLLDMAAAVTIEVAKARGEDDPLLANFATGTPETVRMFVSGLVVLFSGELTKQVPDALTWLTNLSAFIREGGTFAVEIAPGRPLTMADFPEPGPDAGMVEAPPVSEIIALFGLSMTHTPPAEAATGAP